MVDLSNPIPFADTSGTAINYTDVQLIRSADSATSPADGNFGTLGQAGLGSSGHRVHDRRRAPPSRSTTTTRRPSTWSASRRQAGSGTRLVLSLAPGTTLPADYYRLYIPNQVDTAGTRHPDLRHLRQPARRRVPGQRHVDPGHHRVSQSAAREQPVPGIFNYEDLLSNGTNRPGMSGDGVAGGAFTTGFVVVPNDGNIVYARPDYVENPLLPTTAPDGSLAKPYSALAPEGDPNTRARPTPPTIPTAA